MGRRHSTLYFAYGSNMDWNQMRGRCPSARFVCVAEMKDHELVFPRKCGRGHGVASIDVHRGSSVWGVVYQIDEMDVGKLDYWEGYIPGREIDKNSYVREERHVHTDGDNAKPLLVWVYVAISQPNAPLPSAKYKELIVNGAKFWHLPEQYVAELEKIQVQE